MHMTNNPTFPLEEPLLQNRRTFRKYLATLEVVLQRYNSSRHEEESEAHHHPNQLNSSPSSLQHCIWKTKSTIGRIQQDEQTGLLTGLKLADVEMLQCLSFLDKMELVRGSFVCRRWKYLCRQNVLWEPLLFTSIEKYPLRLLLGLSDPLIPAIQVYVLYHFIGLADGPVEPSVESSYCCKTHKKKKIGCSQGPVSVNDGTQKVTFRPLQGVHVLRHSRRSCSHCPSHGFVHEPHSKSLQCRRMPLSRWLEENSIPTEGTIRCLCQQLLFALISLVQVNICHTSVCLENLIVSVNSFSAAATPHSIPLLQLTGPTYFTELQRQRRNAFYTSEFVEGPFYTSPNVQGMIFGFGVCVLELSLGRPLLHNESMFGVFMRIKSSMSQELKSLIQAAINPLEHSITSLRQLTRFQFLQVSPDIETKPHVQSPLVGMIEIPQTCLGSDYIASPVDESRLQHEVFYSISCPRQASADWITKVFETQSHSIETLDLTLMHDSTENLLKALEPLTRVTRIAFPPSMHTERSLEQFLDAIDSDKLPNLRTTTRSLLRALQNMKKAYEQQIQMIDFLFESAGVDQKN